jgi:thiamine-phosphate pyrophosphorylase
MAGGVRLVQYRDKYASRRDLYETARRLREITAQRGVTLIINDHVDVALAVGADGVHLGQEDLPVWVARKLLGDTRIVGVSTHCLEQAVRAEQDGADYIGFGPIFETHTKQTGAPLGIGAIAEVKHQVGLPLYAIGGIQRSHLPAIRAAGADGVAAISAFSGDIRNHVQAWIAAFGRT